MGTAFLRKPLADDGKQSRRSREARGLEVEPHPQVVRGCFHRHHGNCRLLWGRPDKQRSCRLADHHEASWCDATPWSQPAARRGEERGNKEGGDGKRDKRRWRKRKRKEERCENKKKKLSKIPQSPRKT